jgi:hypothetical protein
LFLPNAIESTEHPVLFLFPAIDTEKRTKMRVLFFSSIEKEQNWWSCAFIEKQTVKR